jgi:hypothetical protein
VIQFEQNRTCKYIFRDGLFKPTSPENVFLEVVIPDPSLETSFNDSCNTTTAIENQYYRDVGL